MREDKKTWNSFSFFLILFFFSYKKWNDRKVESSLIVSHTHQRNFLKWIFERFLEEFQQKKNKNIWSVIKQFHILMDNLEFLFNFFFVSLISSLSLFSHDNNDDREFLNEKLLFSLGFWLFILQSCTRNSSIFVDEFFIYIDHKTSSCILGNIIVTIVEWNLISTKIKYDSVNCMTL